MSRGQSRPRRLGVVSWWGLLLGLWASPLLAGPDSVMVQGLFKDAALLEINGQSRLMKVGQRDASGLTLIAADSRSATVEVDGRRMQLQLNRRVGGLYQTPARQSLSLQRNLRREYRAAVSINGQRVDAIIDTGATLVSLSGRQASALGIVYQQGRETRVNTASGQARGYLVMLDRVDLAGMTRHLVPAVVVEGDYPRELLLGMSFLEHMNMREEENILTLTPRYP
ncbi:retroviral-like aspartic protease family protein [Spongiibacter taiwanensis]|uniref:retropepsin-like aspartic protease family protein n=1 Tax=Spongiibacter taiwanensis TaxID=1748242 RepID=UPI002034B789|nr:retropepsin-like aspartic protease [Spongiibacter taiwanensis]USA42042.1 retroviral-like aspartic protease family protein [Spongiibacter taiwanensis]